MADIKWRNDGSGLGDIEGRDDLVMHDLVYRHPVRGAKAGQKEPRKPNISKDTVASISTAKLLYGLAEGEVYGLADGAKSIRLDGTPLVDDAGNPNFEGVTWDFRNGSNDQEYIKGFPDVSNETPINVELRSSQPWIKAFNDTQLSAVRVRLKWNRLSQTNSENGDVTGYKIDYAIDLQTDGGAYQTVLTTKIQDKTSAGYERTHRIDLPKAKTGWQLRVRRITPNSTSDLIQDTMMIDAVAEVIDVKLSYPNTALLGVQYNAELFSNIAKMSVRLKGKIIRVPDNYDPVARTYTGIWTGNFKDAYSNNPAWIFYDLCTQWRGGLGERLDATMIDRWSLYALGQYCDQPVSDGQGGLEPRFTCNVYLQKQEEAYTVLQNIAGIFRAMSFWTGEKIFVDADVPQDSIYTYSAANIVGGVAGIQYSGTRNRDRHTLAKVAWDNPNNDYQTEYEYIRDEKAMSKFGVKVLDLSAFGCTSQAQAQRAGLWALKTEQLETRQVTFSVGLDGAIPRVGNVIALSDEAFAGRANGGRVSAVSDAQYVITVDRDVTVNIGDTLIVNGGSGKSERRNIKSVAGRKITVTAPFTSAEAEHVWAVEAPDLKLMRFRVMSITENDDATYAITGIQHEPQKYDAIDFGTDVKPTEITIVNPETVDAPAAVSITSRHREVQGQMITTLVIGWSQVKGAVAYDVEWRKDDGTWVKVPRTGNVSVEIDGVYSGSYLARVRAVSAFEVQSNATTSSLTTIKGKIGLPPTIVGLKAKGILFGLELSWGFQSGSGDAAFTEIQTASAPDVNVALLGQFSYPTNAHTITGLQGNLSQSYRARLTDKLGFKSAWSAWVTATTDNSVDKILDIISGEIDDSALSDALKQKIERIDDLDDALMLETQARIDEILAEQDARVQAITQMGAGLTTKIDKNKSDLVDVNSRTDTLVAKTGQNLAAIQEETRLRTTEDSALSGRITTLVAQTGVNTAAISSESEARTTQDEALSKRINTVTATAGANSGKIADEVKARADADGVLTERISNAESVTSGALGRITTVEKTASDNKAAVSKVRTDLVAEYKAADKAVNDKVVLNTAAISSESETRATEDGALSSRITSIKASSDASAASIVRIDKAVSDTDKALASTTTTLRAELNISESNGDNLLRNTKTFEGYPFKISTYAFGDFRALGVRGDRAISGYEDALNIDIGFCAGEYYTASFYAKADKTGGTMTCYFYSPNTTLSAESSTGQKTTGSNGSIEVTLTNEWKKYWVKWKQTPTPNETKKVIIGRGFGSNSVYVAMPAFTEGTLVPSWAESISGAIEETKTVATDINGKMEASYVLRTDVGGRVSGFGLMSNATRTDFAINADYFWIAPPTGTAKGTKPFMVLTSPKTINGTTVPAGTYIESAFIHNGAIDTAQIKDAAIKTAQIDNLAVDTLQIADFAVTIPRLREYDGEVVINNSGQPDSYTYSGGVTINSKGSGGVMVQINYEHIRAVQGYEGSGQGHELRVDIRRNSTVIKTYITQLWTAKIFDQIDIRMAALPPFLDNMPPEGNNVYTIRVYAVNTGSNKVALSLKNMTLFIMGVKK